MAPSGDRGVAPRAVWPRNHSNEVSAPNIVIGNAAIANGDGPRPGTLSPSCPNIRRSSAGSPAQTHFWGEASEGAVEAFLRFVIAW